MRLDGARPALAASLKPDLILLDVEMSNSNGFEVGRKLKSDADTATMPLIFITSANGTAEKIQGLNLGAVDYVTKPFDPGEVRAAFSRRCGGRNCRICWPATPMWMC